MTKLTNQFLHRKESVILTAIEIIDELGIQGLSTREIAQRQGISEGTLFRHFASKNDIILAVLDYYAKYDKDIFQSVTLKGLKMKESIIYLVDSYTTYYENYPAITAVMQMYGALLANVDFAERTKSIIDGRKKIFQCVIQAGKDAGELSADIDSNILAAIMLGAFGRICLEWRLSGYSFSLRVKTQMAADMLLKAFCL